MKINKLIEQIIELILLSLRTRQGERYKRNTLFLYDLYLERVRVNLQGIMVISKNETTMLLCENSLGLTCRNMCTDLLTIGYLLTKNDSEVDDFSHYIFSEDFRLTFSTNKKFDLKDNEKLRKHHMDMYENNFGKKIDLTHNEKFKVPKTSKIIDEFINVENIEGGSFFVDEIKKVSEIWYILSKYEHIGYYYFAYSRNISKDEVIYYIKSTIQASVLFTSEILARAKYDEKYIDSMINMYVELKKNNNNDLFSN